MPLVAMLFRRMANASRVVHAAVLVGYVVVFAIHDSLKSPLAVYTDDLIYLPSERFGYSPQQLNDWYDTIGVEGCAIYVKAATMDLLIATPMIYLLVLGSFLVYLADQSRGKIPEEIAYLAVSAMLFDILSTYILRKGCVIYPDRLGDLQIKMGSFGNESKWIGMVASVLSIIAIARHNYIQKSVRKEE